MRFILTHGNNGIYLLGLDGPDVFYSFEGSKALPVLLGDIDFYSKEVLDYLSEVCHVELSWGRKEDFVFTVPEKPAMLVHEPLTGLNARMFVRRNLGIVVMGDDDYIGWVSQEFHDPYDFLFICDVANDKIEMFAEAPQGVVDAAEEYSKFISKLLREEKEEKGE